VSAPLPEGARRWRLVLGRYAEEGLGGLARRDAARDRALDELYGREYDARGLVRGPGPGSDDPTRMVPLEWLGRARSLFPASTFETIQAHALDRYGLTELLRDPATLESVTPSKELLKVLLAFDGRAEPELRDKLRAVARRVIADIVARLRPEVARALAGRRDRTRRARHAAAASFDARATIRENLARWDPERGRILADRLRFHARARRRLPWTVVLCLDQSGSMTDSLIHAAVMAAILAGLPGVRVKMVLFDTAVIDVSDRLADPLETLLAVRLGGGTRIGQAVEYCETLVADPSRTVFALITDFAEGGPPDRMLAALTRLAAARVRTIGLLALDDRGTPQHDAALARRAAATGMRVAATTPDRFAEWLAGVMA
jgi:hypothetical protein